MALFCQTVFAVGQQQALIIVRTELLRVANQIDVCHVTYRGDYSTTLYRSVCAVSAPSQIFPRAASKRWRRRVVKVYRP